MIQNAKIVKVVDNCIGVKFANSEFCHSCKCGLKYFGEIDIKTSQTAEVGDTAVLNIPDRTIVVAPFVLFVLPLLFIGLGIWVGSLLNVLYSVLFTIIFFIFSLGVVFLLDKMLKNKIKYNIELLHIVKRDDEQEFNDSFMSNGCCQS